MAKTGSSWAVRHVRSGGMDGWYFSRRDVDGQLDYWRSEFPHEQFVVVQLLAGDDFYPAKPALRVGVKAE